MLFNFCQSPRFRIESAIVFSLREYMNALNALGLLSFVRALARILPSGRGVFYL